MKWVAVAVVCFSLGAFASPALATLGYSPKETSDGGRYLVIEGAIEPDDNLEQFEVAVREHGVSFIVFNSPGGNIVKAIGLGRMIRALKLGTFQPRGLECASACALAFLGGTYRFAQPGSIGVHKSFFEQTDNLSKDDAVRAIQELTAAVMSYMEEMGVDPALMRISLMYDSDDIRYLSKSEMEHYRVVSPDDTGQMPNHPSPYAPTVPEPDRLFALPQEDSSPNRNFPPSSAPWFEAVPLPVPLSGRVQHPKRLAPLRAFPFDDSFILRRLTSGEPVAILEYKNKWYRVQAGRQTGWVHNAWIWVEQFGSGPFGKRHIQIASFRDFAATEAYIRGFHDYPLAAYQATTGLFAVTIDGQFDEDVANRTVASLKDRGLVPSDTFVTFGNTYIRKVCCS